MHPFASPSPAAADLAERYLAGCMMLGGAEADQVRDLAAEDDFAHYPCRLVYRTAARLRDGGQEPTAEAVLMLLFRDKTAADLGAAPAVFLADLVREVGVGANLDLAAGLVAEAARRRAMIRLAGELLRDAAEPGETADEVQARFEGRLADLSADRGPGGGPVPLADTLADAFDRYDEAQAGRRPDVFPTGLPRLDQMLGGGLTPGHLVVVAARPGVGKSALGLRVAEGAARAGHASLICSLEMGAGELTDRLVAGAARVSARRLQGAGRVSPDEAARVVDLVGPGGRLEGPQRLIHIDDRVGRTVGAIAATARRWVRRHGVRVVILDYLQLADAEDPRAPRHLQVATDCKRLKHLAKQLGVAVVALAQLNRAVEARGDGRPRLADLRESGSIEQDANTVLLLHRLDDDKLLDVHRVDLLVEKQRSGPTGVVELDYHRRFTRFEERCPAVA